MTVDRALAAVVVVLALVGCKAREGGLCTTHAPTCDGARALVCIEHRWVAQRCKGGCFTDAGRLHCDLVEDPQVGEACYDPRLSVEGMIASPEERTCSADRRSILSCLPNDGRWTASPCGAGGECVGGSCKYEVAGPKD